MSEFSRARVVLADDFPAVAEQLRALLEGDFEVVATVGDGLALLEAVATYHPDVIVSDLAMPGLDGIAAARIIRKRDSDARIVLVTVYDDPAMAAQGLAAGALGYVSKSVAGDELLPAVHAALAWRTIRIVVRGPAIRGVKDVGSRTSWTGIVARGMHLFATTTAEHMLQLGKMAAVLDAAKTIAPAGGRS